jgi:hypothetical protein
MAGLLKRTSLPRRLQKTHRQGLEQIVGVNFHRDLQRGAAHVQRSHRSRAGSGTSGPVTSGSVQFSENVVDGEPLVDPLVFAADHFLQWFHQGSITEGDGSVQLTSVY